MMPTLLAAGSAAPVVPRSVVPVLLLVIGVGAVLLLLAAAAGGRNVGRTFLLLVVGTPAAYGLGVLSSGAGDLQLPIGIGVATAGAVLAVTWCSHRREVRR